MELHVWRRGAPTCESLGVTSTDPAPGPSTLDVALADVFRWHPAGVAILTADGAGSPVGMTVSSLSSVSVDPPMVSLSMANSSTTLGRLREGGRAVIHMLDAGQEDLADLFARPGVPVEGVIWRRSTEGAPQLDTRTPKLHVVVTRMVDVGTATLIALTVDRIESGERGPDALVRMGRGWYAVPR